MATYRALPTPPSAALPGVVATDYGWTLSPELWLSQPDAALRICVSRQAIDFALDDGKIPHLRVGSRRFVYVPGLDLYARTRKGERAWTDQGQEWVRAAVAASVADVTDSTILNWTRAGLIRTRMEHKRRLFSREDAERVGREHRNGSLRYGQAAPKNTPTVSVLPEGEWLTTPEAVIEAKVTRTTLGMWRLAGLVRTCFLRGTKRGRIPLYWHAGDLRAVALGRTGDTPRLRNAVMRNVPVKVVS